MNLIDILQQASEKAGRKTYMSFEKEKLTFRGLYDNVLRFAAGLKATGVKKGERVAMLLNNSPEFVIAYFATIFLGAEIVPMNTFLRSEEVLYILGDCRARVFISSPDFKEITEFISNRRPDTLETLITTGEKHGNLTGFNEIYRDTPAEKAGISDNETAAIIYTSGTTGHPKGAMLTHRNLLANVESSITAIKIKDTDRFILFLPMFHSFSFTVCVLIPIYKRCFVNVIKSIQPFSNIVKSLVFDRITIFVAIPQVYNVLAARKIPKIALWLIKIRLCISGAAPLSGEVLKKFEKKFRIPLLEGYGLSEASPVVSVNPFDKVRKAGSVGPAIPGVTAAIMDEDGRELKTGETGEIAVRGQNIMKGYFSKPEETKEAVRDGWLYTGDIGRMDEDGYIYILDRKKDLIIVNGMNLYPREVEEVLYMNPAVEDAAVVGKKDETHGEIPIGVIKLKEGRDITEKELRNFCRIHLANFKIPHRFEFWQDMPRTGTGKILKREIKRMVNERK
jgi:long-chain acyl-CoA synthetase